MKLEINNVGKIKKASIQMNGITVIAGENNTGKSTIGKMLFCIFNSFYEIEDKINSERYNSIFRYLRNSAYDIPNINHRYFDKIDFLATEIVENKELYANNKKLLEEKVSDFFIKYYEMHNALHNIIDPLIEKIYEALLVEDEKIVQIILKQRLNAEFAMKVSHLNALDEAAKVRLFIKIDYIDFEVNNNEKIKIKNYMNLIKDIVYIDDPFILDQINYGYNPFRKSQNMFSHSASLLRKLKRSYPDDGFNALDEFFVTEKLNKIYEIINNIYEGKVTKTENSPYVFQSDKLNGTLDMVNLSTGIKSFAIIQKLLQNGTIGENGIIILDEPEIHLHPEWQLKFAEAIVLIQKEFHTNILLNTHSPYFLNAIEVYSEKYGIKDNCNYYLTEKTEDEAFSKIIDVTDNTERIYEKLAKPLQILEDMEYNG